MIEIRIPGYGDLAIAHLVCDYNGTLAESGAPILGVAERLNVLARSVRLHVVTADTFGGVRQALAGVNCTLHTLPAGDQRQAKLLYVQKLGPARTVAIGNGRNDAAMLAAAAVGIAVINAEGAAGEALAAADVVCRGIHDALALLLEPKRLIATLRA